jgi:16S rRNA (guanine(527)-N(7))-methyltransferase RsmG
MYSLRIAELLAPFMGPQDQRPNTQDMISHISTYIDILQRWNARINLTAIRDEEEIVTRHFGESLFVARHLFPCRIHVGTAALGCPADPSSATDRTVAGYSATHSDDRQHNRGRAALQGRVEAQEREGASAPAAANDQRLGTNDRVTVADVGSGAGFPGIPIKLWAPDIALTVIESNHKKATFLKEITRALILTNVNIQTARAESVPPGSFEVVTLRAVERFESILSVAARLVAHPGRLALLIGRSQFPQAQSALPALHWTTPLPIPQSQSRVLAIACKP